MPPPLKNNGKEGGWRRVGGVLLIRFFLRFLDFFPLDRNLYLEFLSDDVMFSSDRGFPFIQNEAFFLCYRRGHFRVMVVAVTTSTSLVT